MGNGMGGLTVVRFQKQVFLRETDLVVTVPLAQQRNIESTLPEVRSASISSACPHW
jgi:hypothetical protein